MDYVYHGSPVGGLAFIEPKISTHGKNWVYATKNKSIALVYLQRWNDFIFNQSINSNGQQELTERLPNAFEDTYAGKSGFLYYLSAANFLEGQTSFLAEVVSDKKEQVVYCEAINDCYEKLREMERNNEIILFRYPNRPSRIPFDDSDLIKKAKCILERSNDKKRSIDNFIKSNPMLKDAFLSLG